MNGKKNLKYEMWNYEKPMVESENVKYEKNKMCII